MTQTRKIHKTIRSKPTLEGAGVHLQRAFGFGDTRTFDPFLLLDDFRNDDPALYAPGFPWHPHRGIETITYVLRGKVEHGDSMGNHGSITAGDVQWMTAGSGILHQEMPKGDPDGRMHGFQLWANLPRLNKMMPPRYQEVKSAQIPVVTLEGGVTARLICGQVAGVRGPVENIVIDPQYLDISIPANTRFAFPTRPGHTVFAYVIEGRATFCDEQDPFAYEREGSNYFDMQHDSWLGDRTLVVFEDGEQILVNTADQAARFLLISGHPIREPVAWYGPIVMNTEAELRQAFEELEQGTFIHVSPGSDSTERKG
jgi:redox-sensitive bicupin YhaK (pirin superfamily)